MYPSGFDPTQEIDQVQNEQPERPIGSSWAMWLLVMLGVAAVVAYFLLTGDPEAPAGTTLPPDATA